MSRKLEREQFEREHMEGLLQVAEDVRQHNNRIVELENQKKGIQKQIVELENEMKKYSELIGLNHLRNEYQKLEEMQKNPIKTCCKHIKYKFHSSKPDAYLDFTYTYICKDCGFKFDDNSTTYQNLKRMNIRHYI